ncbi:nicotinamide N-methyltransferase-like [Hyla sarda]|uniref:nicotinamide N-methyltransferase-like n=1 Tax=Hyla sarda TaxID=327740 RepID=UPI0024C46EE2|nr:nicotinamide N-methyltransferase-like [Hyla sarda]
MEKALYHEGHDHTELCYKSFFSRDAETEIVLYPAERLHHLSGLMKGSSLIDFSTGLGIAHLLAISDSFQEITLLNANENYVVELEKWRQNHTDSLDFSHWAPTICDLTVNREEPQKLEEKLRKKVNRVLHCDFTKENVTEPHVLPKVDCGLCIWSLGPISTDQASYTENMRKMVSLLKVGGHLVVFGGFNASYFVLGDKKYHTFMYDENTVRTAMAAAGCSIISFHYDESKTPDHKLDSTHMFCAFAIKEREV